VTIGWKGVAVNARRWRIRLGGTLPARDEQRKKFRG
jgi:hypothetical protein